MLRRSKRWIFNIGIISFVICAISIAVLNKPKPIEAFHRLVLNPEPNSVADLLVDRVEDYGEDDYLYVLRFTINRDDLQTIINSRPFERTKMRYYSDGILKWRITEGDPRGLIKGVIVNQDNADGYKYEIIYESIKAQPSWLDLGEWQNMEMYVCDQKNESYYENSQYLIFNNELKQAYFIAQRRAVSVF